MAQTSAPNSYKDPYWTDLATGVESKLNLPEGLLAAVVTRGERSNADQVSEAGAKTPFQIIPSTRDAVLKKYGVDAYLSPQNAAEAAGLLLKESLDRNKGNVQTAVAEYHGGTNQKNWGPRTKSYVARVLGDAAATQAGAPASGGTMFQRAVAAQQQTAMAPGSIASVYDAYQSGKMSQQEAADFEADVKAGLVMLPRGAALKGQQPKTGTGPTQPEPVTLPKQITDAYVNGKLSEQERADLEADMRAGIVKLSPTETSQIPGEGNWQPPTEQGIIERVKEPTLGERLLGTGEAALTTATGIPGGAVGMIAGTVEGITKSIMDGTFGTRQAADRTEQLAMQRSVQLTYQPRTEQGQEQAQAVAGAMQQLVPIGPLTGEMAALGAASRALKPTAQVTGAAAADLANQGATTVTQGVNRAAGTVAAAPGKLINKFRSAASGGEPEAFVPPAVAEQATVETAPIGPKPSMGAAETVSPELFENQAKFQGKPEFAKTGTELPASKQIERAKALQDIGLTEARRSSIVGNAAAGATESQLAKLDNEAGLKMRAQLDAEKQALLNFSTKLADDVGGTQGTDQAAKIIRGNSIIDPIEKYNEWFEDRSRQLYAEADKRAAGVPIKLSNLTTLLKDKSVLTNSDRVHLIKSLKAYLEDLGMMGKNGVVSGNAKQAETVRKYLNENWSPSNGKLVSRIKNIIDDQVMKSAGEDLYGESRKMWQDKKNTIDNPKGIAALIDVDPQGINRKVAVEKIADNLWGQSNDQFQHIIRTIRQVPDAIAPLSQQALTEIKSHFLNQLAEVGNQFAGQWNAKGVAKLLNQNNVKAQVLFSPEEIAAMRTLNTAGNALVRDASYPGAAAQTLNLAQSGAINAVRLGSAAAGSAFGPLGAALGAGAGDKAARLIAGKAALNAVNKRLVSLKRQESAQNVKQPTQKF